MLRTFITTILLVIMVIVMKGQDYDKKNFKVYRTKEGISNNHIFSITQDVYGYIWVATERGLNRFDGANFQQFHSDSSSESLPEDWTHDLRWISQEELGVLTLSGFHRINTKTLKKNNLLITSDSVKQNSKTNQVFDLVADKKENVFLITTTGFYHFNRNKLVFRYDFYARKNMESIVGQFAWNAVQINDSLLLVSTVEGLYLYEIAKLNLRPLSTNDDPFFHTIAKSNQRVRVIYKDEKSFFAMPWREPEIIFFNIDEKTSQAIEIPVTVRKKLDATATIFRLNDSLMALTFSNKGFCFLRHERPSSLWFIDSTLYFENDFCTSILMDKNNRLWVGTINGLYKQNRPGGRIEQLLLPGESESLLKTITAFAIANNKLFTATALEGLYVFDRDNLVLLQHLMTPEKDRTYITHLVKLNEDSLVIVRKGAVLNTVNLEYKKIELQSNTDPAKVMGVLIKDSQGGIYVTKNRTDTVYFKGADSESFFPIGYAELRKIGTVTQMVEDNERNLWFGGDRLLRLNTQSKIFDIYLDSLPAIKTQPKGITSNIVFDNKGNMYFGASENGLIIYNVKEKKFTQIARSQGLPDNTIRTLCLYKNKTLWIGTESGLANYDLVTKKVSAFGASDGMPIDPSTCNILYYDSVHNQLYAGFTHTILRFDPEELKKNHTPPDLFVESIDIMGKGAIHHPAEAITVPYKNNNVIVNFAAINFEDAPQQLFAYRVVKDGNEGWQELGTQRKIFLSNLPAGKHKLQIKAYIRNQSWPDQVKEIVLTVQPPFWKTIWFYIIIGSLIASFLFYLHKRRINKLTQKANIDKLLAQTEMKALHAQMNPHFIFNCLNSIREMILQNENQQASHYLSKFAQLIRSTLNQSSKTFVTLENTIDYLRRYAELEKIRNNKFNCTIEVDDHLQKDEIMIPPMLIQPFLENAIWHGAIPGKELQINIRFKKEANRLVCFVEDNGLGIETSLSNKKEKQADHHSIGIANVKERIQVLNEKYKLNSELSIEDRSKIGHETGTIVKLYFPLQSMAS